MQNTRQLPSVLETTPLLRYSAKRWLLLKELRIKSVERRIELKDRDNGRVYECLHTVVLNSIHTLGLRKKQPLANASSGAGPSYGKPRPTNT